jgi:hypothetical protein
LKTHANARLTVQGRLLLCTRITQQGWTVAEATVYRWKKQYAGLGIAEIRRLKQLEDENRRLKQVVADLTLDKAMLQDVVRRK